MMIIILRAFLPVIFIVSYAITTSAQEKTIKKGNQQWIQYYGQVKLSDKWIFLADGGFRVADNFQLSSQYIIRSGVNYNLNTTIQVGAGFAHLGFYTSGKVSRAEFRPYEELSIRSKLNNIDVNSRIRIEERFFNPVIEGQVKVPGTFNFRFRYMLLASVPLFDLSKTEKDIKVLLSIGDEVFVNAGKQIVYNAFDQNRVLISPTVQFSSNFSVVLTYNWQFAATNTAAIYNETNVVWLQIRQRFNGVIKK